MVYCNCTYCIFREEANEYIEMGALNGLFVLGRSVGFIGERFVFRIIKLPSLSEKFSLFSEMIV